MRKKLQAPPPPHPKSAGLTQAPLLLLFTVYDPGCHEVKQASLSAASGCSCTAAGQHFLFFRKAKNGASGLAEVGSNGVKVRCYCTLADTHTFTEVRNTFDPSEVE